MKAKNSHPPFTLLGILGLILLGTLLFALARSDGRSFSQDPEIGLCQAFPDKCPE
ncbi:MAG: hypothetical protein ACO37W_17625 [Prochlorotrichaceae cyanobacterium]